MPILSVVHQDAPAGHPQQASIIDAHVPRTVLDDLGPLGVVCYLDEVELLAGWIVAADNGFGAGVAKGDPKRAGRALGEFPRPLHGAVSRA